MGFFRCAKYNECKMASKILGNIAPVKVPCAEVHRDKNLALNFYLSQTNQQPMQTLLSAYLTQVLDVLASKQEPNKNLALNFYLSQTNQQPMQGLLSAYLTQVLTPLHSLPNKNQTFKISKIIKKCTFFTNEHLMQLFCELVQQFSI